MSPEQRTQWTHPPMASPSLKLCMPSPMMTIQAMLAIPASFISWSEWQFPPCECPCFLFTLEGEGRSLAGGLPVGESGAGRSLSCVASCSSSQETAVLSGSGRKRTRDSCQDASGRYAHTSVERLQVQPLRIRTAVQLVIRQLPADLPLLARLPQVLKQFEASEPTSRE